jgi:hypothetical protein
VDNVAARSERNQVHFSIIFILYLLSIHLPIYLSNYLSLCFPVIGIKKGPVPSAFPVRLVLVPDREGSGPFLDESGVRMVVSCFWPWFVFLAAG